jgi:Suppressor of fused protein (SUFU)
VADELSPGGNEVQRHDRRLASDDLTPWGGEAGFVEAIGEHLDRCFGTEGRVVYHELVSDLIHLDVHYVPPSDAFPFQRLVTAGMSSYPMTVPAGFEETSYAELTIALPRHWPLPAAPGEETHPSVDDETSYWPARLLKTLGRLPHEYATFLWYGHTIPNGDPPEPYADDTGLCGALIAPPLSVPHEFHVLPLEDGRTARFLGVVPIYEDELDLKRSQGWDALADRFDRHRISDVVDKSRPSVAGRRRWFRG